MKTTLVTGGTGFLGRQLVGQLLERGEENVRVFTRSFDRDLAEMGAEIVEGSLTDPADVHRATRDVDRVYHLAGRVERKPERAHLMYDLHVEGTRRLLGALVDEDIERIVVASTSGTVGVSKDPNFVATEESPYAESLVRRWPYYLSKIYAERVCQRYIDEHELPIVIMRPTLLLGPGDTRSSSTGDVKMFLKGKVPARLSGGLSFVDVRDAARGFRLAMQKGDVGDSYLLGQVNLPLESFFEHLEAISGVAAPRISLPDSIVVNGAKVIDKTLGFLGFESAVDPTSVDMARYYWYIDSTKAREELGWSARDPNTTLRDTVRWIRQNDPVLRRKNERSSPPSDVVSRKTVEFARTMARSDPEDRE
jgi:dihydroflavonol-4-reductase